MYGILRARRAGNGLSAEMSIELETIALLKGTCFRQPFPLCDYS